MAPGELRHVASGHDAAGPGVVLSDGSPPHVTRPDPQPGLNCHALWNTDACPVPPGFDQPGPTERHRDTAPPSQDSSLRIVDIPPEGADGPDFDKSRARAVFDALGPGGNAEPVTDGRHPLIHRSGTADCGHVISGEIACGADDLTRDPAAGDVSIQRGTIDASANRSDRPCRMLVELTDARSDPDPARVGAGSGGSRCSAS